MLTPCIVPRFLRDTDGGLVPCVTEDEVDRERQCGSDGSGGPGVYESEGARRPSLAAPLLTDSIARHFFLAGAFLAGAFLAAFLGAHFGAIGVTSFANGEAAHSD
jgi:hypothetical protein